MKKSKQKRKKIKVNASDFIVSAKSQLSPPRVKRAEAKANLEIINIRLSQLREQQGIRQTEVPGFTQSSVSKIEGREDIKLSTLLQYLEGIDMAIEIKVHPKGKNKQDDEIELLSTG